MKTAFCDGVPIAHGKAYTCGKLRWRTIADGEGRFTFHGIKRGWYIETGSSRDVAGFMSLTPLDPARGVTKIFVSSRKAQPQACSIRGTTFSL
jgi:hypothetical protein